MEFAFERYHQQSRLGKLAFDRSSTDVQHTTPMCLLYTYSGCVPHLTNDVLQKVTTKKHVTLLPMPNVYGFKEALKEFKQGIGKYVAMPDYPLYICNQDPGHLTPTGYNNKTSIAVWNNSGKSSVDVTNFATFIEHCKPQWYQALSDGDTPKGCSKKRVSNSVRYSLELLDKCLEKHSQSEILKTSWIFGSVQGGYDIKARKFSAKHTAERSVDGFVIEGFHCFGPESETMQFLEIQHLIDAVVELLPEAKPRIMHGAYNPLFILEAVETGVDIFDASFPYIVTERGSALVFSFEDDNQEMQQEISLKDEIYKEDFTSILEGCICHTCQNFTKAYVNHLLVTSEMLAPILLMIHNLHHFLNFFEVIKKALKSSGDFLKLKAKLKSLKTAHNE